MKFDILTLFPEMFEPILGQSIIGRAQENNLIKIDLINIRDFSKDKHRRVDDYPYGGGNGMIMQAAPIYDAYRSITENSNKTPRVIFMSPGGKTLTQDIAKKLSREEHLIILCGHYEGIDQRIIDQIVTDEISIGDYVLTGGEIPAMVLIDCVGRLIPGVLGNEQCSEEESFSHGLLEYPQYTRPPIWNDKEVPQVLLSGHHKNILEYQRKQALIKTFKKRPDLFEKIKLRKEDKEFLDEYLKNIEE